MATSDSKGKKPKTPEEDGLMDVMPDGKTGTRTKEYGFNSRSSMIHKLIDVGLLAANFGQLKVILSSNPNKFYHANVALISISIILQFCFLACMLVIWNYEYKYAEFMKDRDEKLEESQKQQNTTNNRAETSTPASLRVLQGKIEHVRNRLLFWNNAGFVLLAVIVVLNVCISVFFAGSDPEISHEKIGKTRYVGVVNGSLQIIE